MIDIYELCMHKSLCYWWGSKNASFFGICHAVLRWYKQVNSFLRLWRNILACWLYQVSSIKLKFERYLSQISMGGRNNRSHSLGMSDSKRNGVNSWHACVQSRGDTLACRLQSLNKYRTSTTTSTNIYLYTSSVSSTMAAQTPQNPVVFFDISLGGKQAT